MPVLRLLLVLLLSAAPALSATFGTPVQHPVPLVDLAYDQARKRLYVLSPGSNTLEIYDTSGKTPSLLAKGGAIAVDTDPISLAISLPDATGKSPYLYVACYTGGVIDKIDLNALTKSGAISLPANPQAVAVGADGKLLISTAGTAQGTFVLTTYDPGAATSSALQAIAVAPPAPSAPTVPPPNGLPYLAVRAHLVATPDGTSIIGVHELANNTRTVFVYQVSSATMLRSRNVPVASPVLAVSADGSRFISGNLLFDTASLTVLAQQNTTNSPFVFSRTPNFTTITNQGGAVFLPNGSQLLTAYNIVPVANPAAQSNTAQLLVNTPNNLLIQLGIQLPQNLSGKMVITPDGATIYALSTSGFLVLPIATLSAGTAAPPIAIPDSNVALLASDQCGALASQNSATIPVRNVGGSQLTVTAQVLTSAATSTTVRATARNYGADITATFNPAVSRSTLGTATAGPVADSVGAGGEHHPHRARLPELPQFGNRRRPHPCRYRRHHHGPHRYPRRYPAPAAVHRQPGTEPNRSLRYARDGVSVAYRRRPVAAVDRPWD